MDFSQKPTTRKDLFFWKKKKSRKKNRTKLDTQKNQKRVSKIKVVTWKNGQVLFFF